MCAHWCSSEESQVPGFGDIGFTLFVILTFRASDAINRDNDGAGVITDSEMNLQNIGLDIVQVFSEDTSHRKDKQRITAHFAQTRSVFGLCC